MHYKVYEKELSATYQILWAPGLISAAETKSIGLPACRSGALFFARHLDYFIVTQNSHPSPGLGTVKTNYHDPKLIVHLPGLAKTRHPDTDANSIKPPGRYS